MLSESRKGVNFYELLELLDDESEHVDLEIFCYYTKTSLGELRKKGPYSILTFRTIGNSSKAENCRKLLPSLKEIRNLLVSAKTKVKIVFSMVFRYAIRIMAIVAILYQFGRV